MHVQTLLDYQETSCLYKLTALLDPEIKRTKQKAWLFIRKKVRRLKLFFLCYSEFTLKREAIVSVPLN